MNLEVENDPFDDLLTAAEVKERFDLSALNLARWIQIGRIKPVRKQIKKGTFIGSDFRFRVGDILDAIELSQSQSNQQRATNIDRRDASLG